MNKCAALYEVTPGRIRLDGIISMASVVGLQQSGYKIIDHATGPTEFDFSDVRIIGSAVIVLMIAWQRQALKREVEVVFTHASDNILAIAEVSGVKDLLSFP